MEASLAATGMFEVLATKAVRFIMDSVTPPSSTVNLRKALTHVIILMYDYHRDNPRFTGLTLTVSAHWYQLIWYILKRDAFLMPPQPPPPPRVSRSGFRAISPTSRSLEFFCRQASESRICLFIFRLVFRSRMFQSSWVQLINRTQLVN